MATPVKMPRLGESVAEGTVGSWLKKEGDLVEKDEALAEIITDKINAELPSPVAGRLTKILVQADETVPVGADIALIEENVGAEAPAPTAATPAPAAASVASAARAPEPAPTPVGASVQQSATATPTAQQRMKGIGNGSRFAASSTVLAESQESEEERQRISPLARRLAREHGIDLNDIVGTGLGGRVRRDDILAYLARSEERRVGKECRSLCDWSSDVCSSDLTGATTGPRARHRPERYRGYGPRWARA